MKPGDIPRHMPRSAFGLFCFTRDISDCVGELEGDVSSVDYCPSLCLETEWDVRELDQVA
jgi:hypothetical protein